MLPEKWKKILYILYFTLSSVNVCNFADDTTPFLCDLNLEVYIYMCIGYAGAVLKDLSKAFDTINHYY